MSSIQESIRLLPGSSNIRQLVKGSNDRVRTTNRKPGRHLRSSSLRKWRRRQSTRTTICHPTCTQEIWIRDPIPRSLDVSLSVLLLDPEYHFRSFFSFHVLPMCEWDVLLSSFITPFRQRILISTRKETGEWETWREKEWKWTWHQGWSNHEFDL